MTTDEIILLVGGIVFALFLIIFFSVLIGILPKLKEKERLRREKVLAEYEKEPEYIFTQAKAVSKRKSVYYKTELRMPTMPALKEEYYVTFLVNGEEKEYPVREEVYSLIEENEEGTLVTVNGNFFDFGDGEETEIPSEYAENFEE